MKVELSDALEQTPTLGCKYNFDRKTARRLLLRRTHYHVYFVPEGDHIVVVAVWSAFRGRGPKL